MSYLLMEPSVLLHLALSQLRQIEATRPWMQPHLNVLLDYGLAHAIANVTRVRTHKLT